MFDDYPRPGFVLAVLVGVLLAILVAGMVQSCATLPPSWCRTERVDVAVVGDLQMRRCGELACDATQGEWIVDDAWMVSQAAMMARLLEKCDR